ncbi:UNVERIFIED_CONTAM: AT-hook motif nuclear-localized protein 14 [Sesamum latifolium]|uniref:AT-hook motif nuclear-localized protein n=1 Tax=Sesamum latifolium TaxID=2727402 RepID=A0AAW2Y2Z0_9LAMI
MEAEKTVSQHAAGAGAAAAETETEVLEVSVDDVEVVVGAEEEKLESEGGGDEQGGVAVSVAGAGEAVFAAKRKRGRPRKQQPGEAAGQQFMAVPAYSPTPEKRGRGRPRGSGKWQTLAASFGGINAADTAGTNFTPYTITIQPGEGQFTIIHLNGSHTYDETRGGKICLLSVQLSNSDGRFYGGAVASSLIAAGPTQLIIGTFRQKLRHPVNIRPHHFASPGPSQTDQKRKTTDAKGKGALVIDPPVVPDDPPVTDEVAVQKGKAPDLGRAAPHPSSPGAATSDDVDGAGDDE